MISVLIPAYNSEKYLAETIESTLNQTFKEFELIIVNDGSTDNTRNIVEYYQSKDDRIKLINQENKGVQFARNAALYASKNDIIALLDSDDIMYPDRLEKQLKFLKSNLDVTVVSCLAHYINADGKIVWKNYTEIYTIEDCKRFLKNGRGIYCLNSGAMFWKAPVMKIGAYRPQITSCEDTDLWNRLAENGYYTVVMPEVLVKYRLHNQSIMSAKFMKKQLVDYWVNLNMNRRREQKKEITKEEFEIEYRSYPFHKKMKIYMDALSNSSFRFAGLLYAERKFLKSFFWFIAAFLMNPKYVFYKVRMLTFK